MTMMSQFFEMVSSWFFVFLFFLTLFCSSLVKFIYWSKFQVNIVTGSWFMTIFFYKGLTINPEIGNTSVWVLTNIWRLGQVRDTKFGTNAFNKMLPNTAKCQGYSFYGFRVIKGKPIEGVKIPLPPTQISVNSTVSLNRWSS